MKTTKKNQEKKILLKFYLKDSLYRTTEYKDIKKFYEYNGKVLIIHLI